MSKVYKSLPGQNIYDAAIHAVCVAKLNNECIIFVFNDLDINVYPESHHVDIVEKYNLYSNLRRLS